MSAYPNHATTFRWTAMVLALSGGGLSLAMGADPVAALAQRGSQLTRDSSGDVIAVEFERPLEEGDIADLAQLPGLTALSLWGPQRDASLAALKRLESLKSLHIVNAIDTDAGLQAVAGLTNLESLALSGGPVSDEGLAEFKNLTKLRELVISNSRQVSDDGLVHLKALPKLKTLWLARSQITGRGLTHLHALPELEKLGLNESPLTDRGLEGLAGLKQLRELELGGCRLVGDEGLAHVAKLPNLRTLKLDSTAITSAGLEHLAGVSDLEFLTLARTKVTNSGLRHLAELDNLQKLFLFNTNVTPDGVAKLKQDLPKLTEIAGVELTDPKRAAPTRSENEAGETARAREGKRRWAIVSTDAKLIGLADLLTAALGDKPDVELVERQQIKAVLTEQALHASGLVAPDQAARWGRLLKADALLLIAGLPQPGSPAIRLRLVEVDTAIQLLDVVLPPASVNRQLEQIVAQLEQAGTKLAVPEDERRYLGIMAIKSEEPGASLTSTCQTLTALVSARLHQRPRFIVVEREQLRRLTEESDLTGAEQRLRGSAWLLEAGVRRPEGGGLVVTCRLLAPAKGARQTFQVAVESGELAEARNRVVDAIEAAIGLEQIKVASADLADEATFFATRRDWLRSADQLAQSAEMAEAALALWPTPDNLSHALGAYSSMAHAADGRLKSPEALQAAHRYQEMSLEWMRKTAPDSPLRKVLSDKPLEPHVRLPLNPESEEVRALRSEVHALSEQRLELLLADARSQPDRRLALLLHRLDHAAYLAETGREFATQLPGLIDEIKRTLGELKSSQSSDEGYGQFAQLLVKAVNTSRWYTDRGGRTTDQREWEHDELIGLWAYLAKHDDPVVRVVGISTRTSLPGDEGDRAAAEIMDSLKDLPRFEQLEQSPYDSLAGGALQRLPAAKSAEFIEGLIQAAEQARGPNPMMRYSYTVTTILRRAEPAKKRAWSERILAVLNRYAPPIKIDVMPRMEVRRWPPSGPPTPTHAQVQARARRIALFRDSIARNLAPVGPRTQSGFSVAHGEGPWSEYAVQPIEIKTSPENLGLWSLWIDRHPEAKQHGDELVLVWSRKGRQLSVERVALSGGQPRKFGPDFPGLPRPFLGIQVASGGGAIFVAASAPGFVCLRAESVETIDEAQGAPASEVHQLAWWKDRLFVAYRNALTSYDPGNKKFTVIASSLTVEPRNPLDGRGSFFVNAMIPDEEHDCLWLHVQDNAPAHARNGVWRYEPEKNNFSQITSERVSWSRTDGGIFLNLSYAAPRWALLDPRDSRLTKLTGYRSWSPPPDGRPSWPRVIKVGDHIITEAGELYTPDGKVHHVKRDADWKHFQPVGSGFLTHFEPQTNRLWHVTRKSEPAEAAAARDTDGGN